jgi:hypothetical protein
MSLALLVSHPNQSMIRSNVCPMTSKHQQSLDVDRDRSARNIDACGQSAPRMVHPKPVWELADTEPKRLAA